MNPLRIRPASLASALASPLRRADTIPTTSLFRRPAQKFYCSPFSSSASSSYVSAPSSLAKNVPAPIPLVPDVASFLNIIGRNMKQHTTKFPTWEALFTLSSQQLRELGVEPPRDRRYLLRWLERFREGRFGIGGDFKYVRNGVAELRVVETTSPTDPANKVYKRVVNVPAEAVAEHDAEAEAATGGASEPAQPAASAAAGADGLQSVPVRVKGYKVVGARNISGPYALPLKAGTGARVTVVEGMWEDKRGRKIDGGERRRGEIRFKRRVLERKAEREQLGMA